MSLFESYGIDAGYVILGIGAFSLLLFVLVIILFVKNSKLRKRYEKFMEDENAASLEKMFARKFGQVNSLIQNTKIVDERLQNIENNLLRVYQKTGIVKYDAFGMGGRLSFVLALLDNNNNGFVINSMHSTREGCYSYIKEIIDGEASVILADEEKQALDIALYGENK